MELNQSFQATAASLSPFFQPRSIAVLGASAAATKIGGRPIRYLQMAQYEGRILPINPERATVQGLPAYPDIRDVEGEVDLAVVAVPAKAVPGAVRACVEKGVKAAVVFSAGFAEAGEEGGRLQTELMNAAGGRIRLLGPNCLGTISTGNGVYATFASSIVDELPAKGRFSLASQSGALGAHCMVLALDRGLGINLWGTTGNQVDVDISDFLEYMVVDPDTDVVLACLEGVRDPQRMIGAFEKARRSRKPVVLLKVGRSEVGAAAVASHTASLAGSDAVFDAVLREHHVHRARSLDELFDVAYACSFGRYPKSRRTGLLTVSGGGGILMADVAEEAGLDIAPMPEAAQAEMKALLPFAGTRNPVDVTAQVINQPDIVEPMFNSLLRDGGYDCGLAFFAYVGRAEAMMNTMTAGLENVGRANPEKFLAISALTTPAIRTKFENAGFAVFEDPSRAVFATAALARFHESFESVDNSGSGPRLPERSETDLERGRTLSEHESRIAMRAAGVPVVPEHLVGSSGEAVNAARQVGFPVVMKIVSRDILHKSEIGGVILDVADENAAAAAFGALMERAAAAAPAAHIDGVLVSPMIKGGVEMILGVSRDPVFGPIVMVGLGGIFVEVFRDVAFGKAPLDIRQARAMLRGLKGHALLKGARGQPQADEEALLQAMVALSDFAATHADIIDSIDINPLLVLAQGSGVVALDALVTTLPHGQEQ